MKIVYHHRTRRIGVEGVHIAGVINGFNKLGHEVIEIALMKNSKNEKIESKDSSIKIKIKKIFNFILSPSNNLIFRLFELFYNFISLYKFISIFYNNRDVNFIYDRYAYFSFVPVLMGKIFRIPTVLEVNIVTEFNDTRKIELSLVCKIIETWVLKNCDKIFVVSEILKSTLVERGIDSEKVIVQANGFNINMETVDISHIINDEILKSLEQNNVICFLGRLLPWYKLEKLIEIISENKKECPNIFLLIIGDGVERDRLVQETIKFDVEEIIYFTGEVTHPEAISLVEIADICVIPETNDWTSPVKLFEYMGMSKPVVAPNIESISSILTHNEHGLLFKKGDYKQLKRSLSILIKDHNLRNEMGNRAYENIKTNFTWDHVAKKVISEIIPFF